MEKKITVNGKEYKIRELLNIEAQNLPTIVDTMTNEEKINANKESIKQETMLCANISEKEYDALTYKEYLTLRQAILQINTPEKDFWVTS